MATLLKQSESAASRAAVYLWCLGSDWSSAATHEAGGQPVFSIGGSALTASTGTLLDVDSATGLYATVLSASNLSVLGTGLVRYSSSTVPNALAAIEVVAFDPFAALSVFSSSESVIVRPGSYSAVTISGVLSGVTIAPSGIVAASIGSAAIEAVGVAATTNTAIADALLARNIAGGSSTGRVVSQALYALRNKVAVGGSTITVFGTDDTTSSWTGSIATVATTAGLITSVDPQG